MAKTEQEVKDDMDKRFNHHPPTPEKVVAHEKVRAMHKELALELHKYIVPSRELSCALTALEESMMWANAGIARN